MIMSMSGVESQEQDHLQIIKGKRTKRQRPVSPLTLAMASSYSTDVYSNKIDTSIDYDVEVSNNNNTDDDLEEEEQDLANCLMLLSRGHNNNIHRSTQASSGSSSYTCKTCDRRFSSFQALGGHRASHKKPKNIDQETKALVLVHENKLGRHHESQLSNTSTMLSLRMPNRSLSGNYSNITTHKSNKIHECSICGAEFSSGQALGGHMRRHRTPSSKTTLSIGTGTTSSESRDSKKLLQLDLNLPALPEDDHHKLKFSLMSKEQMLVFSSVDCHY